MAASFLPHHVFVRTAIMTTSLTSSEVRTWQLVCKEWRDEIASLNDVLVRQVFHNELPCKLLAMHVARSSHQKTDTTADRFDPHFSLPRLVRVLNQLPSVHNRQKKDRYKWKLECLTDRSLFDAHQLPCPTRFNETANFLMTLYVYIKETYPCHTQPHTKTLITRWFMHMVNEYMYCMLVLNKGEERLVAHDEKLYNPNSMKLLMRVFRDQARQGLVDLLDPENQDNAQWFHDLFVALLANIVASKKRKTQ